MKFQVTTFLIPDINAPRESVLGKTTSKTLNLDSISKTERTFLVLIAKHVWPVATTIQLVHQLSVGQICIYQMAKLSNLIVLGGVVSCAMMAWSWHLIKAVSPTICGPVRRKKVFLLFISREWSYICHGTEFWHLLIYFYTFRRNMFARFGLRYIQLFLLLVNWKMWQIWYQVL